MPNTIYTIGYEKRSIDEYVELLQASQIDVIVDVRETAWSHKPGFSKTAFVAALAAAGIAYVHAKFAGNPKSLRRNAASHADCLDAFRRHLAREPRIIDELDLVLSDRLADGQRVALTCFERHPEDCHRSIVAEEWAKRKKKKVQHLAGDGCRRLVPA